MSQQEKRGRKPSCFNPHVLERPIKTFFQPHQLATDKTIQIHLVKNKNKKTPKL